MIYGAHVVIYSKTRRLTGNFSGTCWASNSWMLAMDG